MEPTENSRMGDTQPLPRQRVSEGDVAGEASPGYEFQAPDAGQQGGAEEEVWAQDRIPTPVPMDVPRDTSGGRSRGERRSCLQWGVLGFCLFISLASLALNIVLITNLLAVRHTFATGVDQAIGSLETLELNGFRYEFHLQQTIPFSGDIPFQQDMVFPFKGNVPINTTVNVPIDAGILGQFNINVPINTSIPIDIQVPIHVSQTIHVDTEIPIDMNIPIEISPNDPAIQNLINGLRDWLIAVRESL